MAEFVFRSVKSTYSDWSSNGRKFYILVHQVIIHKLRGKVNCNIWRRKPNQHLEIKLRIPASKVYFESIVHKVQ